MPVLIVVALTTLVTQEAAAQPAPGRFVDRVYRDTQGEHKYVVFEPAGYTPSKKWPVIFYLHGASGRGTDGRSQLIVGMGPAVKKRAATLPFLVVFPQCENTQTRLLGGWHEAPAELDRAMRILETVEKDYAVDRKHEVLVGTSMGGFGVWSLAARDPQRWRAISPISGGGHEDMIPSLAKVPVWAFHALDDTLVPPTASTSLVDGIRRAGGRAFVSLLPRGGHNVSRQVLACDEVFEWFLHPDHAPKVDLDWTQDRDLPNLMEELPFVPGADVAQAVRLHFGRDLLESWAALIPDLIPAETLTGWKPGMTESTRQGPFTFNVAVSGIHYTGILERAWIEPLPGNRLRVQLGLRSMQMTLGSTQLRGRLLRADAGPMTVFIGYNAPVWLTIDIAPRIENRRLHLDLVGVDYQIPPDNWSISRPDVRVRGLPFLEDRISDGLVQGVADKRYTIEAEIRNSVPQMVSQLETRIAAYQDRVVAFSRWPMPLWMPRFKFYPESIVIGDKGVDVELGAIVAALGQRPPNSPLLKFPREAVALPSMSPNGMEMAVSDRLVTAWSSLMATGNVARFQVLDMSAPTFHELGRRAFWEDVLPAIRSLPSETELQAELVLEQPLKLRDWSEATAMSSPHALQSEMTIEIPQLRLDLAVREADQPRFRPYAQFDFALRQSYRFEIVQSSFVRRELRHGLIPAEPPAVRVRSLPEGVDPNDVDLDRLAAQFARGWADSFAEESRSAPLKDMTFAEMPLRWNAMGWDGAQLVARWERPGIRIGNGTAGPVAYQVRSLTSGWSEPLRLAPGQSHLFRPSTNMAWKPAGSADASQYRLTLGEDIEIRPQGLVTVIPRGHSAQVASE